MKLFKNIAFLLLANIFCSFAQETMTHIVTKGETIFGIAKKYKTKVDAIYALNPEVRGKTLQLKQVLQIPNAVIKANNTVSEHVIAKGDTFYAIAKKYGVSLDKLKEYNYMLDPSDLKVGTTIHLIPEPEKTVNDTITNTEKKREAIADVENIETLLNKNIVEVVLPNEEGEEFSNDLIHVVKSKETLYKIAKKYSISINQLKELNPEIVGDTIALGYHLIIKKGAIEDESIEAINEEELADIVAPLDASLEEKANLLVQKSKEFLGVRYRYGGTTTKGFDCSGLMLTTFKEVDMNLPRTSGSQAVYGVKVKRKQAQKGDLIFFATGRKKSINHVGMITEVLNDEIKFIHASTSSGVIISSLKEPYYNKRFVQVTRVLN